MPTSMTTAPGFNQEPLTIFGCLMATTTMSAFWTSAGRSRVREWHTVTVALFHMRSWATGVPWKEMMNQVNLRMLAYLTLDTYHNLAPAQDNSTAALNCHSGSPNKFQTAKGCARNGTIHHITWMQAKGQCQQGNINQKFHTFYNSIPFSAPKTWHRKKQCTLKMSMQEVLTSYMHKTF